MSVGTLCESPASIEPAMKMTIAIWISSFLLNRSASLPQIGVEAVEASSVAVTTQVYWLWVPFRSVMIVGSAFETTVEDRNATNIASNIPDSALRICRCVIPPCCSTGATGAGPAAGPAAARTGTGVLMACSPGNEVRVGVATGRAGGLTGRPAGHGGGIDRRRRGRRRTSPAGR